MRGLSACIFDIHQPDVVALKARLTRDGRSDADTDALPSKFFRDRCLPYTDTLHMQQCHVLFLEHVAHAAVSCFFPRKGTDYVPGTLALEQAKADMVRSKEHVAELAAEEEREFKELAASTGMVAR